jgi:hypothetical protein
MANFRPKPRDEGLLPWAFAWLLSLTLGFQTAYLLSKSLGLVLAPI